MRYIITIALSLLCLASLSLGQNGLNNGAVNPQGPPLDQKVQTFDLEDGALIDGISVLSLDADVNLRLGFEEIICEHFIDRSARTVHFSLHLVNRTVKEILHTLCQHDVRYAWSTDGDSVNVYPRASVGDSSYLLNIGLERIALTDIPDPDQAFVPLSKQPQLLNEQIGYMQTGGDNHYETTWTATFEHLTVRQFANRLAEHMGPRTFWGWQGGKKERMFTFLKGGFHTNSEH